MTNEEKSELLTLLFTGTDPEIAVGQPGGFAGDGLWYAIPKSGGGVSMKACSPRAKVLLELLLEDAK